jgi:hypothetical protein
MGRTTQDRRLYLRQVYASLHTSLSTLLVLEQRHLITCLFSIYSGANSLYLNIVPPPLYKSTPLSTNVSILKRDTRRLISVLQTTWPSLIMARMSSERKARPLVRQLEFWLISFGMSVFAYLLEQMILRSLKKSGAKP